MSSPWLHSLHDLVQALQALRQRLRQTARVQVAQAVSAALQEAALTWLGCTTPSPPPTRPPYASWGDPWREQDPDDDPWTAATAPAPLLDLEDADAGQPASWPPALLAGLGAARWSYGRTGQLGLALLLGVLAALAAQVGPPALQSVLAAWGTATDLLGFPAAPRS